jgi:small-conductance mechanosensitive channel
MDSINKFLEFQLINIKDHTLSVYTLVVMALIFLFTKMVLWLIKKAIFRKHSAKKIDKGNAYALFQIIRYVVWIISIALILETIGVKVTVLIAGSAALLVGVGLGLQQTFNDIISGIILLSERSIKVGDILEIDGDIVKIQVIGFRTSKGMNRDEISIIIPNSLITTNKVINWSHQSKQTRFKINIGVAYGSDLDLVVKVLTESAMEHDEIIDKEHIDIRFADFGNSSLDFQILFYSKNIFRIEKVKSDIRKIINRKFAENKITVPFPQMDLHYKSKAAEL